MNRRHRITASILSVLLLTALGSEASDYNYRNILVGSRAAMLGGAYTAMSEDLSATYYNPAGIAFLDQKKLLASIDGAVYAYNLFAESGIITEKSLNEPNAYRYKLNTAAYQGVPNLFGLGTRLGDHFALAISFATTDVMKFSDSQLSYIIADREASALVFRESYENRNDLVGPTLAVRITEGLGIGVSVFYQIASYRSEGMEFIKSLGPNIGYVSSDSSIFNGAGLVIAPGIKWNITPELKMGLLYSSQTQHIHGKEKRSYVEVNFDDPANQTDSDIEYVNTNGRYWLPHRLVFGIAYDLPGSFVISADAIYYFPLKYGKKWTFADRKEFRERAHYDLSLGFEYFMTKSLSLRTGVFTNTSSAPQKSDVLDIYGGTLGLGMYRDKGFSSGIGLSASYGERKGLKTVFKKSTISYIFIDENVRKLTIAFLAGASKEF